MKKQPPVLSENHELKVEIQKIFNLWCIKSWSDNEVIEAICKLFEPLIQQTKKDGYKQGVKDQYECQQIDLEQAKAEERKKVLTEIQAGAVSVAGLIEKARQEVAREILEVYDRYVKLLGEEIDVLSPLAISHGWRSIRFEAGADVMYEAIREEIEKELLTDEETWEIQDKYNFVADGGRLVLSSEMHEDLRIAAQAQLDKVLKALES